MSEASVIALRGIELGVADLDRSAKFYGDIWGLDELAPDGETRHFRATGAEHHVLTLRQSAKAGLLGVYFAARDRDAVNRLHAKARAQGVDTAETPAQQPRGGGYGFHLRTPDGVSLNISSEVVRHHDSISDRSRPTKLTHVVLNSARIPEQVAFFRDVLGFRLSDSTQRMEFMRCGADHHSVALAHGNGPSLNHMAFEMPSIDGLMRGCGRVIEKGFSLEWGVGRHGPGNNVFSYFVDPDGFVVEYTAEVDQIDEAEHVPGTAEYWASFPMRPCRWGMARTPSERLRLAMSGKLAAGH